MRATISRWGNSLALRVPKAMAEALGICEGDQVDVIQDGSSLRITRREGVDIQAMIAAITPENLNIDREWIHAPPVGKEIW